MVQPNNDDEDWVIDWLINCRSRQRGARELCPKVSKIAPIRSDLASQTWGRTSLFSFKNGVFGNFWVIKYIKTKIFGIYIHLNFGLPRQHCTKSVINHLNGMLMKTAPIDHKRTCLRSGITESCGVDSHVSGTPQAVSRDVSKLFHGSYTHRCFIARGLLG